MLSPLSKIERVIPILNVKDISVSKAFYISILGFNEEPWGSGHFTSVERDNMNIYLARSSVVKPSALIWIGFDGDIFALYEMLKEKRVTILQPPTNFSWALQMDVEDPDGHVLRLGTEPDSNQPFADQE
jgi:hypothetical protein